MALIGYTNRVIEDVYMKIISNDTISKLVYYDTNTDTLVSDLEQVKNPVGKLKDKIWKNRRLDNLQREAGVGVFINMARREAWREYGKKHDKTLENTIQVGIVTHLATDNTVNGSRLYAIADLIMDELSGWDIDGLGQIHFRGQEMLRDLNSEFSGYALYFTISSMRGEHLNVD